MKLQIVPAGQGVQWVKQGMRTFWRQPLALSGLFFMFMAAMSLLSMVPLLGNILALVILPGATLGLMAATKEALTGKFPMPVLLVSAFRAGKQQLQAMLLLGAIYAAGFLLVLGISAPADGGKFAQLYLVGGAMSVELLQAPDFQLAVLLSMALYLPLSLLFWHAPALVHWHGVQPVKSLFFSLVACLRNFWAFTLFGLAWMGVFVGMGTAVSLVASLLGSVEVVSVMM
ncbi:MAG TPA: BPSS1780 family membrane protein, partial [Rhodoferax sp.]|nr:BPSS1780 family membrane protein [Rhodoferax sp.]